MANTAAETPPIGEMDRRGVLEYLEGVGDDSAGALRRSLEAEPASADQEFRTFDWGGGDPKPWQHSSHTFGFIPPQSPGSVDPVALEHAGTIKPSTDLKNKRVTIALDRLRVYEYPGRGIHNVLFNFYAEHHVSAEGEAEQVNFAQTYRIQSSEGAGISGYPVFRGLQVGQSGIAFKGFTVNVSNENDRGLLDALDSAVFQSGLKMITTANPAIKPLASMAEGIARSFLKRNENVKVQDFYLGLDFSQIATGARLALGSYVVVQVPRPEHFSWERWVFNPRTGEVVANDGYDDTRIPYNYLIFSVAEFLG